MNNVSTKIKLSTIDNFYAKSVYPHLAVLTPMPMELHQAQALLLLADAVMAQRFPKNFTCPSQKDIRNAAHTVWSIVKEPSHINALKHLCSKPFSLQAK